MRDGKRAIGLATISCEATKWGDAQHLQTLAASYAEVSQFDLAVRYQERALDLKSRIAPVSGPTLFVWGSEDLALGETAAPRTAEYVTGPYRFERLEGKSHWLVEEVPELISTLLLRQLKNGV